MVALCVEVIANKQKVMHDKSEDARKQVKEDDVQDDLRKLLARSWWTEMCNSTGDWKSSLASLNVATSSRNVIATS